MQVAQLDGFGILLQDMPSLDFSRGTICLEQVVGTRERSRQGNALHWVHYKPRRQSNPTKLSKIGEN